MRKFCGVILGCVVVLVMGGSMFNPEPVMAQTEQITLTTYYPSPFGVYRQLRARQMAVGPTWADPAAAPFDTNGICLSNEFCDGQFFVEGNVGIGTRNTNSGLGASGHLAVYSTTSQGHITIGGPSDGGLTFSALYFDDATLVPPRRNSWVMGHLNSAATPGQANNFNIGYWNAAGAGTSFFQIDDVTGNVGIGLGNPQARLDIAGKARSLATATTDDDTTLTTKGYVDLYRVVGGYAITSCEAVGTPILVENAWGAVTVDGTGTIATCQRGNPVIIATLYDRRSTLEWGNFCNATDPTGVLISSVHSGVFLCVDS